MNSIFSRESSVNLSRSRRALAQPRFLLAMTAMATAIGGFSYLASGQSGRTPVKMTSGGKATRGKTSQLADIPALIEAYGQSRLAKSQAKRPTAAPGTRVLASTIGTGQSGFNLVENDLTPNSFSDDREPVASPGGDFIAFASNGKDANKDGRLDSDGLNAGGRYHIWVMNRDGSNQRQVTGLFDDQGRNQRHPTWSPDGNQLAYIDGDDGNSELFVADALANSNGGTPGAPSRRTFFNPDANVSLRSPAWSPDGQRIVFAANANLDNGAGVVGRPFNLFTINSTGEAASIVRLTGGSNDSTPGTSNTVTVDDLNPAFALANSNVIYFSSNRTANGVLGVRRIWRMLADGTGKIQVTDPLQRPNGTANDSDDFPTPSLLTTDAFGGSGSEQVAFQTNTSLDDTDVEPNGARDLNIWALPLTSVFPGAVPTPLPPEPRVFVSEFSGNRILNQNPVTGGPNQNPLTPPAANNPEGVVVQNGTVYFANRGTNQILRFDEVTGVEAPFTAPNSVPSPAGLISDGQYFYVAPGINATPQNTVAIYRFNFNGASAGLDPTTSAAFSSGEVTAADKITNGTEGLAFSAGNNRQFIYTSNFSDNKVNVYRRDNGRFVKTFVASGAGGLNVPTDLTFGPDINKDGFQDLYVNSSGSDDVKAYAGPNPADINAQVGAASNVAPGAPLGDVVTDNDGSLTNLNAPEGIDIIQRDDGVIQIFVSSFQNFGLGSANGTGDHINRYTLDPKTIDVTNPQTLQAVPAPRGQTDPTIPGDAKFLTFQGARGLGYFDFNQTARDNLSSNTGIRPPAPTPTPAPPRTLPLETDSPAIIQTNILSSPRNYAASGIAPQNGTDNVGQDKAPDVEPTFSRSIATPQVSAQLMFASTRRFAPMPSSNSTGGNRPTASNPFGEGAQGTFDIWATSTADLTPPALVPQSIGNQSFPVVSPLATAIGQGQGNPRTFEAGLRPGAAPGTSGSLKLAVVINERESGLSRNGSIVAVIRNADQVVVNTGQTIDFGPLFGSLNIPDPLVSAVDETVAVTLARERGYTVTDSYPLTAVDDGVNEKQAGAVAGDGVYYCSTDVVTPASGEYYIDIIATDRKGNTFTYDNIWGFATRPFSKARTDLLVSDYTVGQLFPNILSGNINFGNEGGDDGRFAAMFPVESYLINANGATGTLGMGTPPTNTINPGPEQSQANAFPTADVWRILCRGPVTSSLLSSYKPSTTTQIDPKEVTPAGVKPYTARTRNVTVASASVTWASPYTGEVFAGPGTLVDAATQSVLTDFSNAGGRLFVMGRDVGFGLTSGGTISSDFLSKVMGANYTGDVPTGNGGGLDPGVTIISEVGGFIRPTLTYGNQTTQDRKNLEVPFHYENKNPKTDNWDDAALNLNPNTSSDTSSDGSNTTFFRQAVGVQPDAFTPTNSGGAKTEAAYSVGGRTIGQRLVRQVGGIESRSVLFGFGLESINRRYRRPTNNFPFIALNARANVVRGIQSYLKTGSLSGKVINAATNLGIPDFLVLVTLETDANVVYLARTDQSGNYSVSGLPESLDNIGYRVEPAFLDAKGKLLPRGNTSGQTSPPGFFAGTTRNTVEIVGGFDTPNVNLRPIPIVPGSLSGKVVTTDLADPSKQVPANGVYVLVRSVNEASIFPGGGQFVSVVKTDALGNFTFSGVPALVDLEVILNPALTDIPAKSGLRANFSPPAFTGTFQNPNFSSRLITGLSRPSGSATPGLQVPSNGSFVLNDSTPDDKADSGTPLLLGRFLATVTGKVTVNGVPTGDVTVQLLTSSGTPFVPSRTGKTNTSGTYTLTNVPTGSYIVKATTRLGATANSAVFTVSNNGNSTTITVPTINITAPTLSGLVKLRTIGVTTTETNLANATVELLTAAGASFSPAITTTTGTDGKYLFNVVAGSYKVRATYSANGSTTTSAVSGEVRVVGTSGNTAGPTLIITSFEISGRVVSSAGAGQARAVVELDLGTAALQVVVADTGGNFKFSNVGPGSYIVKAVTTGGATGQTTLTIASNAKSVPAIKVVVSGTGGTVPVPPGNGDGTDGGGSTTQTFAANSIFLISLPYATDNVLGTVPIEQAFSSAVSTFKLFRFNAAGQINKLSKDFVQVPSGFQLKRGEGYMLQTLDTPVTTRSPLENASLKSFAGTSFTIPLTWNDRFLSDTGERDNRNNGYNAIGFPFNPAKYSSVSFLKAHVIYGSKTYATVSEAAAAGIISNQMYGLNAQGVRVAIGSTTLVPFTGYFVRILRHDQTVKLVLDNPTAK